MSSTERSRKRREALTREGWDLKTITFTPEALEALEALRNKAGSTYDAVVCAALVEMWRRNQK